MFNQHFGWRGNIYVTLTLHLSFCEHSVIFFLEFHKKGEWMKKKLSNSGFINVCQMNSKVRNDEVRQGRFTNWGWKSKKKKGHYKPFVESVKTFDS